MTVGCGGSHQRGIARAEAVAYAHAVNLRPSDVPGMSGVVGHEQNGQIVNFRLTPERGCGAEDSGEEFVVYSGIFRRSSRGQRGRVVGAYRSLPAEGLHSRVAVMQSTAEQERDFAASLCDHARSEAARGVTRSQDLPSPLPGLRVLGVRSWRVAPKSVFGIANVTLYDDHFSFVVGPAEIVLNLNSAPRPPSPELERRLLSLLYNRAKAHKL
jgi:hypothetical protein